MASLYADEQFPLLVVELLRNLGHDVLTVQEAGNAGHSDLEVLGFAMSWSYSFDTESSPFHPTT